MKKLFMFLAITTISQSYAATTVVEFDEATEIKCHAEIKAMGCTNKADEEVLDCVESKKVKLSKDCKSIHSVKMSNK